MARKLTYEEVKHFIEVESGSGCKLLNKEYVNATSALKILCKCGKIFNTSFNTFKSKHKHSCDKCVKERVKCLQKIPFAEVKKFVEKESDCVLLSTEYKNNREKLLFKCKCGNIFEKSFGDFKSGQRQCNVCSNKINWNIDSVRDYVAQNSDCILLSNVYKKNSQLLYFKCKCGKIFSTSFAKFKDRNKRQCNECSKRVKWDYNRALHVIMSEGYTLLDGYIDKFNANTKINIRCPEGHCFKTDMHHFNNHKNRCPYCINSKGELKIKNYLDNYQKTYEKEKTYSTLKNEFGNLLRYDFYIENKIIIEYDGQQHFEFVKPVHKNKFNFKKQVNNDKTKNQYCIDNSIPLIRIPYWEYDNIEYILKNTLMHFDLIQKDNTYDESIVKKYLVDENWDHDKYIEMSKNY